MTLSFKLNPQKDPESDFFITQSQLCFLRFKPYGAASGNRQLGHESEIVVLITWLIRAYL
jgi:hypothetical protein